MEESSIMVHITISLPGQHSRRWVLLRDVKPTSRMSGWNYDKYIEKVGPLFKSLPAKLQRPPAVGEGGTYNNLVSDWSSGCHRTYPDRMAGHLTWFLRIKHGSIAASFSWRWTPYKLYRANDSHSVHSMYSLWSKLAGAPLTPLIFSSVPICHYQTTHCSFVIMAGREVIQ